MHACLLFYILPSPSPASSFTHSLTLGGDYKLRSYELCNFLHKGKKGKAVPVTDRLGSHIF
jgi:hypothetical protein